MTTIDLITIDYEQKEQAKEQELDLKSKMDEFE
jgi:hypothetical protein